MYFVTEFSTVSIPKQTCFIHACVIISESKHSAYEEKRARVRILAWMTHALYNVLCSILKTAEHYCSTRVVCNLDVILPSLYTRYIYCVYVCVYPGMK